MVSAPGSLREDQRRLTRDRIVDAACRVFEDVGYGAASISDITRVGRVNRATFYLHFPDKESVFVAAFARRTGEVAPYWAGLGRALARGGGAPIRDWLDRAMGWWDESAAFQPAIRESQSLDPRFAVERRAALDELAAALTPQHLARFPPREHDRVRRKIVLLMLQLDVAWYQWHVTGTYAVDRDELLDTLCALWCSTLALPPTS